MCLNMLKLAEDAPKCDSRFQTCGFGMSIVLCMDLYRWVQKPCDW